MYDAGDFEGLAELGGKLVSFYFTVHPYAQVRKKKQVAQDVEGAVYVPPPLPQEDEITFIRGRLPGRIAE